MTHKKSLIPLEYRDQFVRDFKLPIKLVQSPLFEYYLELFDNDLDSKRKESIFLKHMEKFNSLDELKDDFHFLKKDIVNKIQSLPQMTEFMNRTPYQSPYKVQRGGVYNHQYTNKRVVSIDLIAANFNSMRYVSEELTLGCKTFNDLLSKFTQNEYYSHVKVFRQLVFEQLNSNKQQNIQREMMDKVLKTLFEKFDDKLELRMPSNDEICVTIETKEQEDKIKELIQNHELSDVLKVESFYVKHLEDDFFYQIFDEGKIRLRNVPSFVYSRFYKKAKGLPLTVEDSYFNYEGRLAQLVDENSLDTL